jgi:CheY-like chemotaxis protein
MPTGERRILVVDDEPDIAESLVDLIHLLVPGAAVEQAPNAEQALAMLRKHEVDLLVTDFMMPGLNGMELLREAKRLNPHLANILVTAYGPEVVEESGLPPPDHLLHKPIDIAAFQGAVNEALTSA